MKHKILLTVFLAASSFADQKSSLHVFHNGWHELNPIYGSTPSTARFVATHSVINVAEVIALWKTRGKFHKAAIVLAIGATVDNGIATAHNYSLTKHPGHN